MHHLLKPMKARKSEGHIFIFAIKLYIYNFTKKLLIYLYYREMAKEMKKLMEMNEQKSA